MKYSAVNIPPSGNWGGNDGLWSTFYVQIGKQLPVEVLPSTSGDQIWTVYSGACGSGPPYNNATCTAKRGGTFSPGRSPTFEWVKGSNSSDSAFHLGFWPESFLGGDYSMDDPNEVGFFGTDDAVIGWQGGPALDKQMVVVYTASFPWLGQLGLSPYPGNETLVERYTSILGTLVSRTNDQTTRSWAYTAGAFYKSQIYLASLVFGGYDSTRGSIDKGALVVPIQEDNIQDLRVRINQININHEGSTDTALGIPRVAFVDSVVPEIWLPPAACKSIASALGLQWDDRRSLYLISDTQHQALQSQNVSIDFILGGAGVDRTTTISLPYEAFYQPISYPLAGITDETVLHYFALKQAASDDQVYLGRTFLQEA